MSLSSADRSRTYRARRKRGLVRLPVDLGKDELDQPQAHGYIDAKQRGDRYCLAEGAERGCWSVAIWWFGGRGVVAA